jgi:hypothetical protein
VLTDFKADELLFEPNGQFIGLVGNCNFFDRAVVYCIAEIGMEKTWSKQQRSKDERAPEPELELGKEKAVIT